MWPSGWAARTWCVDPTADYFAATIPRAVYVVFPGDGHLVPLPRWAEMLAWLH